MTCRVTISNLPVGICVCAALHVARRSSVFVGVCAEVPRKCASVTVCMKLSAVSEKQSR